MTDPQHTFLCASEVVTADRQLDGSESQRGQIKSRERVRDLAEVYTHEREVHAMLELIPDMFESIDSTFLEPACGDGNFLVEILHRKLSLISESTHGGAECWFEIAVLRAAATIYAIDISEENVFEAHRRMLRVVEQEFDRRGIEASPGFGTALTTILKCNVVCGDTLNRSSEIQFVEWKVVDDEKFVRTPFPFEEPEFDLFYVAPEALAPVHYSQLDGERLA